MNFSSLDNQQVMNKDLNLGNIDPAPTVLTLCCTHQHEQLKLMAFVLDKLICRLFFLGRNLKSETVGYWISCEFMI